MLVHGSPSGSGHEHEMTRHLWCLLLFTFNFTGTFIFSAAFMDQLWGRKQCRLIFHSRRFYVYFYSLYIPMKQHDKKKAEREVIDKGACLSHSLYTRVPATRLLQQQPDMSCFCLSVYLHEALLVERCHSFSSLFSCLFSFFNFHKSNRLTLK